MSAASVGEGPATGRLAGKRAIITGGASGIGAATAQRFREEGARVVVADLAGGDVDADVRSAASIEAAVAAAVERLGGLDIAVCNAGKGIFGPVHELTEADWDDGMATNLKGVWLTARAAWPHLARSRGCILSTASVIGVWGDAGQGAYCASKAGVIALTKCMALDGAPVGIRANCICPGVTETPLVKRVFSEQPDPAAAREAILSYHPLGLGVATDLANAYVYLASEEARWVTGHALVVDGGMTIGMWRSA